MSTSENTPGFPSDRIGARDVERSEKFIASTNGTARIRTVMWKAKDAPRYRATVQLVHGMAEHIDRYGEFASYLASQGFVVVGHDHIGHGKSVVDEGELGCLPLKNGKTILVDDVARVREELLAPYKELPSFIFGHSMGSFVTRLYITRYPQGLSGAILCGTGSQPYALSLAGRSLARLLGHFRGDRYVSRILHDLGAGAFSAAIEQPRTEFDWISVDPRVVDAYIADPLSGAKFSTGGYATLTDMTAEVVTSRSASRVPADLPLLFIAGAEDPVGSSGAGVDKAVALYREGGVADVREILYPGMRHEILNEPDRHRVFDDVLTWMVGIMTDAEGEGEEGR